MSDDKRFILPASSEMDPRRVHTALTLLSDRSWWTLPDLVRATAAPRRAVEALLAALSPERAGERFRLTAEQAGEATALLASHRPFAAADPVEHLLPPYRHVVRCLGELIADAPRGRYALGHVAATPETVVRRALLLGARYWLRDSRLLCVGDHDLTSLAVGLIYPHVQTVVVDIDDRILAYIDQVCDRLGLPVQTRWADLRFGLPPSVVQVADLAITDPPYTPDGVGLFVARAIETLRDHRSGRVLLAYGASDRTPALALKVQSALQDLNMVFEAIYPGFNCYFGAEAIGSAADLYVLRPTSRSLAAAAARAERLITTIYTQGPQSAESRARLELSPGDVCDDGFRPDVLVGSWPAELLPELPRVRLTTWLAKPYTAAPRHVAIAVPPGLEAALARILLASRAQRLRVLTGRPPDAAAITRLRRIVAPAYELTAHETGLEAARLPEPPAATGRLLRRIFDHAHGKLANAWSEGLIDLRDGLTKRQARTLIAQLAPWAAGVTLLELPLHRLRSLPEAVRASAGATVCEVKNNAGLE